MSNRILQRNLGAGPDDAPLWRGGYFGQLAVPDRVGCALTRGLETEYSSPALARR